MGLFTEEDSVQKKGTRSEKYAIKIYLMSCIILN
nr:MAG TPA: hypothetical protein [Caudoviricetes sp.]